MNTGARFDSPSMALAAMLSVLGACNPLDIGGTAQKGDLSHALSDMSRGVDPPIEADLAGGPDLTAGPDLAYTPDLTCGGGGAGLATDVALVDFGVQKAGTASHLEMVRLVNIGNAEITVSSIGLGGKNPNMFEFFDPGRFTLAACGSKAIIV